MERIVTVRFEDDERRPLMDAMRLIRIAFPNYDEIKEDRDSEEGKMVRALSSAAGANPVRGDQLESARWALRRLEVKVREQSEPGYWHKEFDGDNPVDANGNEFATIIAEARLHQIPTCERALAVIQQGMLVQRDSSATRHLDGFLYDTEGATA
jgi:hypothetical protein